MKHPFLAPCGLPLVFATMLAAGWVATEAFQGMGRTTRPVRTGKPVETDLPPIAVDFRDVAEAAGLTAVNVSGGATSKKYILETTGNGIAVFDSDNDGLLDVYVANGTTLDGDGPGATSTGHLYRNLGQMKFEDVTQKAGLAKVGWGQGVCVGDYDNDGFRDLFVTHYGQSMLYRNRGDGTFEDATEKAGLRSPRTRWDTGCTFFDYDRDGRLDLAVTNYLEFDRTKVPEAGSGSFCLWKGMPVMCGPRGLPFAHNYLFHNDGGGRFSDVSSTSGIGKTKGCYGFTVVASDFDNDDYPDLYVACDSTPSLLYRNEKNGTFRELGLLSGVALNEDGQEQGGMGIAAADYDEDGDTDIFKTNFSDDIPNLYHNIGGGTFEDRVLQSGLGAYMEYVGWGAHFLDVDHDGRKDLFLVNGHVYPEVERSPEIRYRQPRLLYWNVGGRFKDVYGRHRGRPQGPEVLARVCCWRSRQRRLPRDRHQQHGRAPDAAQEFRASEKLADACNASGAPISMRSARACACRSPAAGFTRRFSAVPVIFHKAIRGSTSDWAIARPTVPLKSAGQPANASDSPAVLRTAASHSSRAQDSDRAGDSLRRATDQQRVSCRVGKPVALLFLQHRSSYRARPRAGDRNSAALGLQCGTGTDRRHCGSTHLRRRRSQATRVGPDDRRGDLGHRYWCLSAPLRRTCGCCAGTSRRRSQERLLLVVSVVWPAARARSIQVQGAVAIAAMSVVLAAAIAAVTAYRYDETRRQTHRIVNPDVVPAAMDEEGAGPASPFFPSSANTTVNRTIPANFFLTSESCARCHREIYDQWNSSAHHFSSFNNQWYRKSIEYMQDVVGTRPSKWCAGCHDHAVFFNGRFDRPIREQIDTPEAQAGLGCTSCHAITRVNSTMGQGDFVVEYPPLHDLAASDNPVLSALHDWLLYLDPKPHRETFLKPFHREQTPEFCASCHKVHLDVPVNAYRWFRGFNDYDNWQASGVSGEGARSFYYPPKPQRCADCHMPLVDANDPAAKNGMVRSHRFAAANTALPFVNGDRAQLEAVQTFLRDGQISVDVFGIVRGDAPAAVEEIAAVYEPSHGCRARSQWAKNRSTSAPARRCCVPRQK